MDLNLHTTLFEKVYNECIIRKDLKLFFSGCYTEKKA